jgi:predicted nucleotidyltransferase
MADGGDPASIERLGNAGRQRLLRAMTAYHARQPWARAFLVFGSVGRGDWDDHSDLDLDVIITDDAALDPVAEATRLCDATGETPALIAPRRGDDAEIVLESLAQCSIRYHPLAATSPNILDSMRLLWGDLNLDEIRQAGLRNATPANTPETTLALTVRALLYVQIALARGQPWRALASLDEARDRLLNLYAATRDLPRPLPAFEREVDVALRAALARLVATLELDAIRAALLAACDVLDGGMLARLANDRIALTDGERHILTIVRQRLQSRP